MRKFVDLFRGIIFTTICFILCGIAISCGTPAAPEGFVTVEGGTFSMGTNSESVNERPVHTVKVDTFYMMATEVTQELFAEIMGKNPSYFQPGIQSELETVAEGESQARRPVEGVSWYEALIFCNKMSERAGLKPCYSIGKKTDIITNAESAPEKENAVWTGVSCNWKANGYRLPTEAEWEYAARGGKIQAQYKYAGSAFLEEVGWFRDNAGYKTHEVAQKKPNALGLYDMSGNVFELCWDWLHAYKDNRRDNPAGPYPGTRHVERGGCYSYETKDCTVTLRYFDEPNMRSDAVGFRVVRRP